MTIKQGQQLSLFDAGPRRDPWKHDPATWTDGSSDDIVAWHSSQRSTLPTQDDTSRDVDWQGNLSGLHLGTYRAAWERTNPVTNEHTGTTTGSRDWVHPARINRGDLAHLDSPLSDEEANDSYKSNEMVEWGGGVAYVNDAEDPGSTSYRVAPKAARTWADDVQTDPTSHPALKHLASRGYNLAVHLPTEYAKQNAAKPSNSPQGRLFSDPQHEMDQAYADRENFLPGEQFKPQLRKVGKRA